MVGLQLGPSIRFTIVVLVCSSQDSDRLVICSYVVQHRSKSFLITNHSFKSINISYLQERRAGARDKEVRYIEVSVVRTVYSAPSSCSVFAFKVGVVMVCICFALN